MNKNSFVINLNGDVNGGESVTLEVTKYSDMVNAVVSLNSYGSQASIEFYNLTPEVLRGAADKLDSLMKG